MTSNSSGPTAQASGSDSNMEVLSTFISGSTDSDVAERPVAESTASPVGETTIAETATSSIGETAVAERPATASCIAEPTARGIAERAIQECAYGNLLLLRTGSIRELFGPLLNIRFRGIW